jgi:hypothetical protein
MTGPEHYREAERLVDSHPQQAQVHALLAIAAATANPLGSMWQDVTTTPQTRDHATNRPEATP